MVEKTVAERYMFSIIVATILVIGVIFVSFFIIKPLYVSASQVTSDVKSKQTELNKLEAKEAKLAELKNQEAALDKDAMTVSNALPSTSDVGRLFIQLSSLANNAGGSVQSVSGGNTAVTAASIPGVQVMSYSLPISFGSYFNFKSFLSNAESALRLVSIDNLSITSSSTGAINASISLTTYTRN